MTDLELADDVDYVRRCDDRIDSIAPPIRCDQAAGHDGDHRAHRPGVLYRWHDTELERVDDAPAAGE